MFANQTFREIFPSEVFQLSEGIEVKEMSFLFTDLKSSTEIYDSIGDVNAFALVSQHFETLSLAIGKYRGTIIKTIGDAVMATFTNPLDAVQAAVEMIQRLERLNDGALKRPLHLKIGIHHGGAIAVNMNDKIDFFGQTVNVAARVQGLADAKEMYITQPVYQFEDVRMLVQKYQIVPETAHLKGVQEKMQVYKIKVADMPA